MSNETVRVERQGPVAWVTLNRPEVNNAINHELAVALQRVIADCATDEAVRVVVMTGAGRAFCAGGDLVSIYRAADRRRFIGDLTEVFHRVILDLRLLPKPVIAAIHGAVAGAGFSLAMACDLRVVASTAKFQQAYTSRGLSPDGGWTALVTAQIGLARATELLFLDEVFDAERALHLGVAHRVVPPEHLAAAAHEMALSLSRGAATAYARAKALLNQWALPTLAAHLEAERREIMEACEGVEGEEGMAAFLAKRVPNFVGARNGG